MFKIQTYLVKHSHKRTNLSSFQNTRDDYIGLEESSKLKDYFAYKDFSPEYIHMLVTIQYKDKVLVGIDGLSGLDLWEQTYFVAIEQYVKTRSAETMYGIDPVTLKFQPKDNTFIRFTIIDDWPPNHIYAEAVLPEKEFLGALLMEAVHFWEVLLEYKVFEGENKREDTPSDYPAQMITEVKKLGEKIKLL